MGRAAMDEKAGGRSCYRPRTGSIPDCRHDETPRRPARHRQRNYEQGRSQALHKLAESKVAKTSSAAPGAPLVTFVVRLLAIMLVNAAVQPLDRYFKFAAGSVGRELKVNRTAKFMRDKFANYACPIAKFARSFDDGSARFLPFDDQPIMCFAVR